MLRYEFPDAGGAQHLPLLVVGFYQAVAVEQNAATNHSALARMASGPLTLPGADSAKGAAACSTKSSAMISSQTARFFRLKISSKWRLRSSLLASDMPSPFGSLHVDRAVPDQTSTSST